MRFIPTRVHGPLGYLVGPLLIAAPWVFNFARGGALLYSVSTDYELGLVRRLSTRRHLTLDLLSGPLLAASPWLFGFSDALYAPHLALGVLEVGASPSTRTTPYPDLTPSYGRQA